MYAKSADPLLPPPFFYVDLKARRSFLLVSSNHQTQIVTSFTKEIKNLFWLPGCFLCRLHFSEHSSSISLPTKLPNRGGVLLFDALDYLILLPASTRRTVTQIITHNNRREVAITAFLVALILSFITSGVLTSEAKDNRFLLVLIFVLSGVVLWLFNWISAWLMYFTLWIMQVKKSKKTVGDAVVVSYFVSAWLAVVNAILQMTGHYTVPLFTWILGAVLYIGLIVINLIALSTVFHTTILNIVFATLIQLVFFTMLAVCFGVIAFAFFG